jgi:hypothetical protein
MPYYRVEIWRYFHNGPGEKLASYEIPEGIIAEAALNGLTVDGITTELKRRLKEDR